MSDDHSTTRIKKLPPLLINQLAAGEVVTRPAAVVKELLENAIDAGATHIEIRITQGGMGMIEVADNGIGIHPDDIVMAITRHATSKVADVANLHGISTLGFRGEALAATAAVSRMTLISSHDDSGIGRQLQVAGILADTPALIPIVHKRGTTVTVKDLYFNVPARRGNLKSIATEFAHIETIVREVALARADITLSLFHDNKKRLSLLSSQEAETGRGNNDNALPILSLARLEQALGLSLSDEAIAITLDLSVLLHQNTKTVYDDQVQGMAYISGWLWPCDDRQESLPKLLYINGRLIKEPIISNKLRQLAQSAGFESMGYALYFELPYHWLNLNIHPAKQRIKISPLSNIMAHLSHAIQLKLKSLEASKASVSKDAASEASSRQKATYATGYGENYKAWTNSTLSKKPSESQQVQTPKQSYQYLESDQFLESSKTSDFTSAEDLAPVSQKATLDNYSDDDTRVSLINRRRFFGAFDDATVSSHYATVLSSSSLPHCLEVVDSLAINTSLSERHLANDDQAEQVSSPPWLLFYSEGQLVLVSVKDWQSGLKQWFGAHLSERVYENDTPLTAAMSINQQLHSFAAQMPAQDLQSFITDIQELLSKQAIKTIDTQQLLTSMLVSKSSH